MIHLIAEYAEREGPSAELGFLPKVARWAILCDEDGRFLSVVGLGEPEAKKNPGRRFAKCPDLNLTEMKAGGITKSHFLLDTAEVVALLGKEADALKTLQKHEYFVSMLRQAAVDVPLLGALAASLGDGKNLQDIRTSLAQHGAKPTDKVTFQVSDSFPIDSAAWHPWWRSFRQKLAEGGADARFRTPGHRRTCFLTGELAEPARVHPLIRGLAGVGGLPMGDVLIGFKQESFCSYGFSQAANCAMSAEAAKKYKSGLDDLIERRGQVLAGTMIVHWFRDTVADEDDPVWLTMHSSKADELAAEVRARELLQSVRTGKRPDLAGNRYYALTISGAAGRVMVRDWMEGQFEELAAHVEQWFHDLAVVHRDGGRLAGQPRLAWILGSTVRDLKDVPPSTTTGLWRAAIRGEPIPGAAMAQALARARMGIVTAQPFDHSRMALLKAYLIRKNRVERGPLMSEELKPYLNPDHPDPAYQCGRMMAVLAELQRAALGNVGAGVVQRYYAAASSTPALVFGRLIRNAQFHINGLKDRRGLAYWFETRMGEISSRLASGMPSTLTLEGQSLFALGYYQQLADMRTKKESTTAADEKNGENQNG